MKCVIVPAITGATGLVTKGLKKELEAMPADHSIDSLHKTAVLGTAHNMGSTAVWNWKTERWGSLLVQGEKYWGEKGRDGRHNNYYYYYYYLLYRTNQFIQV